LGEKPFVIFELEPRRDGDREDGNSIVIEFYESYNLRHAPTAKVANRGALVVRAAIFYL
jgi:hypothetical protein